MKILLALLASSTVAFAQFNPILHDDFTTNNLSTNQFVASLNGNATNIDMWNQATFSDSGNAHWIETWFDNKFVLTNINNQSAYTFNSLGYLTAGGFNGDGAGLTNANASLLFGSGNIPSVYLGTNSAPDGQVLSITGNKTAWIAPSGVSGQVITNGNNFVVQLANDNWSFGASINLTNRSTGEISFAGPNGAGGAIEGSAVASGVLIGTSTFGTCSLDVNANFVSVYGYLDNITNSASANRTFQLGSTNYYFTFGPGSTIGLTGVINLPTTTERYGLLHVITTGTVTFTNPASMHTSDSNTSRVFANNQVVDIRCEVMPGLFTNLLFQIYQ